MSSMSSFAAVLVLMVAVVPAFAADYTVGDTSGWTTGVDYDTWASDKTFNVGDTLLFSYGFLHTVNEVSKSDYDSCSSSNSLESYSDQSTKITLNKPGSRYFICGTASHCTSGMKLTVNTASSSESTPTSGSPPSTPTESTPSTPTESTPSTPSSTPSTPSTTTTTTTPSESTPKKNTPATTGVNGAANLGFSGGNALVAGIAFFGLAGLMT